MCGRPTWECDRDSGHSFSAGMHLVTCHRCLEILVTEGEQAVARIIQLDQQDS